MGRFRNYIFAVAGFVILASAFTVIGPYVDIGQSADPPVKDVAVVNTPLPVVVQNGDKDVIVVNTAANPVPVVVQNGGEPVGEEDIAIVGCAGGFSSSELVISVSISSFSAGVPSLSELNDDQPCADAIAALTKEGFQRSGGGNGSFAINEFLVQKLVRFVIVMTRNKMP